MYTVPSSPALESVKESRSVYKSMQNKLQHSWRRPAIFMLIVVMMGSLFFSRALLSMAMMAFVAVSFFHKEYKQQLSAFFASPLLWGMSLLFFIPALSGFWSADKNEWADILRIKLPLLFLPLAFAGSPGGYGDWFNKKQWEWLGYIFIGLVTAGTSWSMFHYVWHIAEVNASYLQAKTMLTPLGNDHIRFSWLVSVSILLAGRLIIIKRKEAKGIIAVLAVTALWLIVFLHLLAARTGLFSFYIMVTGLACWLLTKKIRWQFGLVLLASLLAMPLIAYKTIASFHNRVQYFLYDKSFFEKAQYLPGSNDGARILSLKGGWHVMNDHPLTGVGFGDVLAATKKWYVEKYPTMIETDKIYPSSEWLLYGAACGWPGFLLFSIVMLAPFLIKTKKKGSWYLLNATAAFSFLFDIGLEVQFGVFIYSFIILWWWKWLNAEKM